MTNFTVTPGLDHLLAAYLQELAADAKVLQDEKDGPLAEIAYHAHGLGGKCAMIGDRKLADHLYEMERQALADQRSNVDRMLAEFAEMVSRRT